MRREPRTHLLYIFDHRRSGLRLAGLIRRRRLGWSCGCSSTTWGRIAEPSSSADRDAGIMFAQFKKVRSRAS